MNQVKKARKTTATILTTSKKKKKKKARQSKDKANCENRLKILTSDLLGKLEQLFNIKGFSGKGRKPTWWTETQRLCPMRLRLVSYENILKILEMRDTEKEKCLQQIHVYSQQLEKESSKVKIGQ